MSNVFGILRTTIIKISLFIILLKNENVYQIFFVTVYILPQFCVILRARVRAYVRACVCVTYDISMSFVPTPGDATG